MCARVKPCSTAVLLNTQILSSLSPKRDCGPERVRGFPYAGMSPRKAKSLKEKTRRVPTLARKHYHRTGYVLWKLCVCCSCCFCLVLLLYLASTERHCSFQFVFDNVEHLLHAFLATNGEGKKHRPPQQHRGRSCESSVWGI